MTIPTNRMSYQDIYEMYDKAGDDPLGIRVPFTSRELATTYRTRMHKARVIDRDENRRVYERGHPMHGQSAYDKYQISIRQGDDDTWFVYIEPRDKYVAKDDVEFLSEVEGEEDGDSSAKNSAGSDEGVVAPGTRIRGGD